MLDLLKREIRLVIHNFNKVEDAARPLVVSQAGIGDLILGLPLIQRVAQSRLTSVDVLTTPDAAPIAKLSPWVGNVYELRNDEILPAFLYATIRSASYSCIYSIRTSAALFARLLEACDEAYFQPHPTFERLRLTSRMASLLSKSWGRNYYERAHMAELLAGMSQITTPMDEYHLMDLPGRATTGQAVLAPMTRPATVIHVGGGQPIRRPFPGTLARVIDGLKTVALVGFGEADARAAEAILAATSNQKVLNLVNRLSLIEIIQLLEDSDLCIAPDSGIMHLAACGKVPIIALMGNARPATFGPNRRDRVVILDLAPPCSPCSVNECSLYSGGSCVQAITPEMILKAAATLAPLVLNQP